MIQMIVLASLAWILIGTSLAAGGFVDLSPDEQGDRVAVVKDGKVAYLPARRANIGSSVVGGGACRYIRRAANGDLYVTGPGLGLFRSTDSGLNWTQSPLHIESLAFTSAFTILDDDTFLISYMPPPLHQQGCSRPPRVG